MTTKHTQGPWKTDIWTYEDGKRKELCIVNDKNRLAIVQSDFPELSPRGMVNPYTIEKSEAEANARLIAAAPELLAALEWALENLGDDLDPDFQAAKTQCEMVLKKAKGEL